MALIKPIATGFGIDAQYWAIIALDVNRMQSAAQVTMAGYLNEEVRRAGCQPLAVMTLPFAENAYPGAAEGVAYRDVYESIKAAAAAAEPSMPFAAFSGAADG